MLVTFTVATMAAKSYDKPEGAATLVTVIVTVAVVDPAMLVAVMVYVVRADSTVGIPEITPVVASMLTPLGKAGAILKLSTVPVTVGVE